MSDFKIGDKVEFRDPNLAHWRDITVIDVKRGMVTLSLKEGARERLHKTGECNLRLAASGNG